MRKLALAALVCLSVSGCVLANAAKSIAGSDWVTAWTTSTFAEKPGKDTPALEGSTLRQVVQVTLAAKTIRVRIGNFFGAEPLEIGGVSIGPGSSGAPDATGPSQVVRFGGNKSVSVPAGGTVASDPVELDVKALENLNVDIYFTKLPSTLTYHSVARAKSYLYSGNTTEDGPSREPASVNTRWYFLSDIEVVAPGATAVSAFGDSIADGNGIPDDSYARWSNVLSRRVQAEPSMRDIAVLNSSIGTNCLLTDGMTPKALSRVYRDVFDMRGIRTLIVALGVNDLGTGHYARRAGKQGSSPEDIIGALETITKEAHERGIYVICTTITPYKGADFYWDEQGEADRIKVNDWIRSTDLFDHMIDFDAVVRDPADPQHLSAVADKGDHLHLSVEGYKMLGDAIPLGLLKKYADAGPRKGAKVTAK